MAATRSTLPKPTTQWRTYFAVAGVEPTLSPVAATAETAPIKWRIEGGGLS
jgi:hypothetical protein